MIYHDWIKDDQIMEGRKLCVCIGYCTVLTVVGIFIA